MNTPKPWKVLHKKILLKTPYSETWQDDLELPDGTTGSYYIVRKKPFSIAIPLYENKTMLVNQYRPAIGAYSMEFPMGYVAGKSPVEMAELELLQETGIHAKKFIEIGHWFVAPGQTNQVAHAYVAENVTFGEQELDPGEFVSVKECTIEDVGKMIESGIILDSSTITSFHLLEKYMRETKA